MSFNVPTNTKKNSRYKRNKKDGDSLSGRDRDLRSHNESVYGSVNNESDEFLLWTHRLKSGWFKHRAVGTLKSRREKMVEEESNWRSLNYRDGKTAEDRRDRINNHIRMVDDEISYYEEMFNNQYPSDYKANDARRIFFENERRKVTYGNINNREDFVTLKKFDEELLLFRDQILESIQWMEENEEAKEEEESVLNAVETVPSNTLEERNGDFSTFMNVCGFLIDDDHYYSFRDESYYEHTIDKDITEEFYDCIELCDVAYTNRFDFEAVRRHKEKFLDIRQKYLQNEEIINRIILFNHVRNYSDLSINHFDFRTDDYPEYNIVFLASGSGKSTLANRFGDLLVDSDLLNVYFRDDGLRFVFDQYLATYPADWERINRMHQDRLRIYQGQYRNRILLVHSPEMVPPEILKEARVLFLFRQDRTGIRYNDANVDAQIQYLKDMKKRVAEGTFDDFPLDSFRTVVTKYDTFIFEIIRHFDLELKFKVKVKYKYRSHLRKPMLE